MNHPVPHFKMIYLEFIPLILNPHFRWSIGKNQRTVNGNRLKFIRSGQDPENLLYRLPM